MGFNEWLQSLDEYERKLCLKVYGTYKEGYKAYLKGDF